MAYVTTNPPQLLSRMAGKPAFGIWLYASADAAATVDGSGYFSNGYDLGMRLGDLVLALDTNLGIISAHYVNVSGTTIDLGNGTTIGSATNSD